MRKLKIVLKKYLCYSKKILDSDEKFPHKFKITKKPCNTIFYLDSKNTIKCCPVCGIGNRNKLISRIIYDEKFANEERES